MLQQTLQPESQFKFAYQLRLHDEIDAMHGRIVRRCRVVKHPVLEGDLVRLVVAPASQPWPSRWVRVVYRSDVQFEIYPAIDRHAGSIDRHAGSIDRYLDQIPLVMAPEDGSLTARQIADRLKAHRPTVYYSKPKALAAARELVRRGVLLNGRATAGGNTATFRLPLPKEPGFPVVELPGMKSERVGWIVAWQSDERPIIRWVAPGYHCSMSHEGLLEPLRNPFQLNQVRAAKKRLSGVAPPIPIPENLLIDLCEARRAAKNQQLYGNCPALLEVAIVLNLATGDTTRLDARTRNKLFEYLGIHYPNWKAGGFT